MKWCNLMKMWCSDMDEEEYENLGCDGKCNGCHECEDFMLEKISDDVDITVGGESRNTG